MVSNRRLFRFRYVYDMAAVVDNAVDDSRLFRELDWNDSAVLACLHTYSRLSLLHYYIRAAVSTTDIEEYHHNSDIWVDAFYQKGVNEPEDILKEYELNFVPMSEFTADFDLEDNSLPDHFQRWFDSQIESYEVLWERITDEVFHLLFANRNFLLRFNKSLAEFLNSGPIQFPSSYVDNKGVLKRQGHMPSWAKKAVYCRDHGRCVLCQRDLTGLLSTDRRTHYDHMVPLSRWGINDPCNLQLLCEECNLHKSDAEGKTTLIYPSWWDY